MLRTAVIGVGHLGKHHARILKSLKGVELVGVCDADAARANAIAAEQGVKAFTRHQDLIGKVDAVTIAVPTVAHHDVARDFISAGAAVLVEKPMTKTIPEAESLVKLARSKKVALQVGHVERFNPAVLAVQGIVKAPRFIEVHRLSPFRFRSTDIDVVMDLMIHDLDIILSFARSPLARVDAVGVSLLFGSEDIANARLEFANGCVANVTASRVSDKAMRKIRIFSEGAYVSIDTLEKSARIYRSTPELAEALKRLPKDREPSIAEIAAIPKEFYSIEDVKLPDEEPLANELKSFVEAVVEGKEPVVPGEDGVTALKAAEKVLAEVRSHKWT